mmetsp:Transcript_34096/g.72787  ORF Transcript_34096/g.72787 Transcript_34096/m.72787 type:complete len:152 (-) Transcript_34096:104-559(-)
MKPDWDTLSAKYEESSKVLIADVDCTTKGHEPLCEKYGVKGFPTIKYFNPPDLEGEVYSGGRTLADLQRSTCLCLPRSVHHCSHRSRRPYILPRPSKRSCSRSCKIGTKSLLLTLRPSRKRPPKRSNFSQRQRRWPRQKLRQWSRMRSKWP